MQPNAICYLQFFLSNTCVDFSIQKLDIFTKNVVVKSYRLKLQQLALVSLITTKSVRLNFFFLSQGDKSTATFLLLFWSLLPVLIKWQYFICFTSSAFCPVSQDLVTFQSTLWAVKNQALCSQSLSDSPRLLEGVHQSLPGAGCSSDM